MSRALLKKGTEERTQNIIRSQLNPYSVLVAIHYSCLNNGIETFNQNSEKKESLFETIPLKVKQIITAFSCRQDVKDRFESDAVFNDSMKALGYSCSGQVIAVGEKVTMLRSGDYVACAGGDFDTYANIVCVPEKLAIPIDQNFVKQTSSAALAAVALHALHRARVGLGETVCIIGLGLLGQLSAQLAKISGCKVIGIDLRQERIDLAKNLGTDVVFLANSLTIEEDIAQISAHKGIDCTLITASSKSSDIIQLAMNITRKKGCVVVVGDVGLHLERNPFCKKEIDLLTSYMFGPGTHDSSYETEGKDYPYPYVRWTERRNMEAIVNFIEHNQLNINALLPEEFSVHDIKNAYDQLKTNNLLGATINCTSIQQNVSFVPATRDSFNTPIKFLPALYDDLRIGIIGVSDLPKNKLHALTSSCEKVIINAVSDYNIGKATKIAHFIGAKKTCLDENELFNAYNVDAVVIASPYRLHSEHALQALQLGKGVFVERPMVTSLEQYEPLKTFLERNPNAPLCVDYSRSFAPFIQKIKWEIIERNSPLVMHYRINAFTKIGDNEINNKNSFGNVIEEACSIFDLFYFLTGSEPVSLSVESLKPNNDTTFPTDNFSISISFRDGSIGSLLYTSLGNQRLDVERFELFFDQKSIVMKDFKTLRGFGTSRLFDETTSTPDKGYENLINQFFKALKTKNCIMPIPLERLQKVAELTLLTDKLVCEGGGTREL